MLRYLLALPLAALACYSLIGVMAWMVDLNTKPERQKSEPLQFNIFALEKEQVSEKRRRSLPEPPQPEPPAPKPEQPKMKVQTAMATPKLESVPDVQLDLSVTGMEVSVPVQSVQGPETDAPIQPSNASLAQIGQTQQVMPLHRIEPSYPQKALQRKIEGYVSLRFTIDRSGKPTDIEVIDAKPARIFNRDAIKALRRWRYQPKMVNGVAHERVGQEVKLEFKIRR
ncbi:energy transducer TonB [Vibrio sp. HN007]|uniref:energy transducer TonB n=1 Tax=Vibrio iocasae TaxID=3098914 RepID=UPI0035D49C6E